MCTTASPIVEELVALAAKLSLGCKERDSWGSSHEREEEHPAEVFAWSNTPFNDVVDWVVEHLSPLSFH